MQRSIIVSISTKLTISAIVIYALSFVIWENRILQENTTFAISLATFLVITILILIFDLKIPLSKILIEIKALLTGNAYHKIKTQRQDEIGLIANFFNEVTTNLEDIYSDIKMHKRIQKELSSAQDIQRMLIPKTAPEMRYMEITAKTRPASEIGGDTFDFYTHKNRNLLYIGDSTGHGIPAGIVMVMVDALLETFIDLKESLKDIVITLNKYLKPHLKPSMFMTMMLLEWIPEESKIKWAGAGHEHLIHVKTTQKQVGIIMAGGVAIGMVPDNSTFVKEQELNMEENDFIILYSDGITEAKNPQGEEYGLKRLSEFIKNEASVALTSEDFFKKIAIDVGKFMGGSTQLDDMTLIVMKHTEKKMADLDDTTEWKG